MFPGGQYYAMLITPTDVFYAAVVDQSPTAMGCSFVNVDEVAAKV